MSKNDYNPKKILLFFLIVSAALGVRIAYTTGTNIHKPIMADAKYYYIYAHNLLHKGVFSKEYSESPTPDSYWTPGYPAFLAASKLLFGNHFYKGTQFAQAVIGALTAGMAFRIGVYFLPLWAAALAGFLAAFSPHMIAMNAYILTETLFAFCLALGLLFLFAGIKTEKKRYFSFSGAVSGIAYLVNPVIFFFPFIASALLLSGKVQGASSFFEKRKKIILCYISLFLLPWLLWSARGYFNVPANSLSSSNRALDNFIIGSHHDFYEYWRANPRDPQNPATLDQKRVDGSWLAFLPIIWDRVEREPAHYLKWYLIDKPVLLWSWNLLVGQGDVYVYPVTTSWFKSSMIGSSIHFLMGVLHWPAFVFAISGLFFLAACKQGKPGLDVMMLYAVSLYVSAVYVVFQSEPRYSIPLRPEMYLCASFALWKAGRIVRDAVKKKIDPERISL